MLSVLRRFAVVIAIAIAFLFGLATTVYLSLRSPEVKVPDVMGKDRFVAENDLKEAGLNFRVRATRPSNNGKPDTVLFQLPRAGEVVKVGQTVAVDVSRVAREGEVPAPIEDKTPASSNENKNTNDSAAANANSNKANRNRNSNKNSNGNANANGNTTANGNANNRTVNANRANANANAGSGNGNTTPRGNANTTPRNVNAVPNANRVTTNNANANNPAVNTNNTRPTGNANATRRPPATTPTPQD